MAEGLAFRPIPVTDINKMMNTVLLPTAYLAPVSYYSALYRADEAYIEIWEHYVKQTIRNRCQIAGPDGMIPLSIPVVKANKPGQPICETRISDHGNWRHLHWRALQSAYGNSPFFEYYEDDFRRFYQPDWEFLTDYNRDLMTLVCELLDITPRINNTEKFQAVPLMDFQGVAPRPYYQVFSARHGFIPDLSIVDLLFNMGPESVLYL